MNNPCTIAVKSKSVFTCLILLLVNSAKTEAIIETIIKIIEEKDFVKNNSKIWGTNKISIVVEILVIEGVKNENGAIVKSL